MDSELRASISGDIQNGCVLAVSTFCKSYRHFRWQCTCMVSLRKYDKNCIWRNKIFHPQWDTKGYPDCDWVVWLFQLTMGSLSQPKVGKPGTHLLVCGNVLHPQHPQQQGKQQQQQQEKRHGKVVNIGGGQARGGNHNLWIYNVYHMENIILVGITCI